MARILGIDYGSKKVGLALTDPEGHFAFPEGILVNDDHLIQLIAALVKERGVTEIVMGESVNYAQEANPIMGETRSFAEKVAKETGITPAFVKETLTSKEAQRQFESEEKSRKEKTIPLLDASAAALILEQYLKTLHTR